MGRIINTIKSNVFVRSIELLLPGFGVLEGIWRNNGDSVFSIVFYVNGDLSIYGINKPIFIKIS